MTNGTVFDIQHFCTHDGPGIRTTVFLKGCPLRCLWCHNPEGLQPKRQLRYRQTACITCGLCAEACPHGLHQLVKGQHTIGFNACRLCGQCVDACPSQALDLCGQLLTPRETVDLVLSDRAFYGEDGGVTFSGGEPLQQYRYVADCMKLLADEGIGCCVDTSLYATREALDALIPMAKLFLCDIKAISEDLHCRATGVSNRLILDNLRYLSQIGFPIWIRVPVVSEYNGTTEEMDKIAAFVATLSNVKRITLIPYHKFGNAKYPTLGYDTPAGELHAPSNEAMEAFREHFAQMGLPIDQSEAR